MYKCRSVQCVYIPTSQSGSVLVISLIILLVVSLLAVGGMQGTIMQERMSANMHDRELAFQAAEAGLREAEAMLLSNPPDAITNTDGVYDINHADTPNWGAATPSDGAGFLTYGGSLNGVAKQPQYYVEQIEIIPTGTPMDGSAPPPPIAYYRITALGFGATEQSRVIVRSVFRNQ